MKKLVLVAFVFCFISIGYFAEAALTANPTGETLIVRMLNQDPDPAIAGDTVEVRIGFENYGDKSTGNYIVEVAPEYPFEAIPGEYLTFEIGSIAANVAGNNMKIVKFKVKTSKDTTAGSYRIPVLYYEKGNRVDVPQLFSIDIESKESAEIIYIDQVELIPGQITPLTFTIHNVGSTTLRELSFKWENGEDIILPVGSDNTKYIKYIEVGDEAKLKFDVIASATADPDLYKLDLTLTYDDPVTGEEKTIETKAGVYVGGSTDFDITYSGTTSGETSFSISNIGSVAASSVTVRIPDQKAWKVTGSNSVIIGNLNEGDYTIASFTLASASQASNISSIKKTGMPSQRISSSEKNATSRIAPISQQSTINIEIVYTDSRGNRKTLIKEIPIDSSSFTGTLSATSGSFNARSRQTENTSLTLIKNNLVWIGLGIIALIFAIIVRNNFKKGRLSDPDYSYQNAIRDIFRKKKKKQVK
ncbi:MAG: COG1361 S-layer family protein [archaeon]